MLIKNTKVLFLHFTINMYMYSIYYTADSYKSLYLRNISEEYLNALAMGDL